MRRLYERLKGTSYGDNEWLIVVPFWALFMFICLVELAKGVGA